MQAATSTDPGPGLVESELQDQVFGWVLLVAAVLLVTVGVVVWLLPGALSVLDSSDVRDWWRTSAGYLATGVVSVVLALTSFVTGLLLVGRRRWDASPVVLAAVVGTCAVLVLVVGGPVHATVVLGAGGALLVLLRRRPPAPIWRPDPAAAPPS